MTEGVRFGLCAVKNVGEGAILSMLAVRKELGGIDSLYTLCEHVDLRLVNKRVLESLVKAGALDSLAAGSDPPSVAPRAALRRRRQGDRARRPPSARPREGAASAVRRRSGMLATMPTTRRRRAAARRAARGPRAQQLAGEKEALGLYMSGHPLERFAGS